MKTSSAEFLSEKCPKSCYGSFRKNWKTEKCHHKSLRPSLKKVKNRKMFSKIVTALHEKSEKLKNFIKKRYGPFRKQGKNWKNGPPRKNWKTEKCSQKSLGLFSKSHQKALKPFSKKSENMKNVFKNRDDPSRKKSEKLKNVLINRYGPPRKVKNILNNCYGPFWKKWKTEKCSQKSLRPSSKRVKNWKISSKSVTVLLEQSEKLKNVFKNRDGTSKKKVTNVLKKRYGLSRKKVKNWKMFLKTVTALLKKKWKTEKCSQKSLQSFSTKSEQLKNVFKKSNLRPRFSIMSKMFSLTALVCTRSCTHWFFFFFFFLIKRSFYSLSLTHFEPLFTFNL